MGGKRTGTVGGQAKPDSSSRGSSDLESLRSFASPRVAPSAPFHPELSLRRRWAVLICFVWAAAISIMSQLTMTTCLPSILADFGVATEHGQWLTTSYMLALGIMVPCSGFFTARF